MEDERFMRLAIEKAGAGIEAGQTPFGACIVKGGEVVSVEHNLVWATTDITAHGEVVAIRAACRALDTIELDGCVIYSTCEPCPMCFSAIHWAKIAKIVYGAEIADAQGAGFNELTVSNAMMKAEGGSPVEVVGGFMREECRRLFADWLAREGRRVY